MSIRSVLPALVLAAALALPVGSAQLVEKTIPLPGLPAKGPGAERYVVGFFESPPLAEGDEYEGGRVVRVDEPLRFAVVETQESTLFQARTSLDDNVRYVERDDPAFGITFFVPNDAQYGAAGHYGSKKIGAETAWDRTQGATSVKVGVLDTGLRKTHEEFAGSGRVLQGYDFVNGDGEPNDDCGHGTHVSGTIGATINNAKGIAGLAQVTLLPIKGLGAVGGLVNLQCTGSTSALASGLRYAADQGAHISSNSWGGGTSSALNDAITYAYGKGVTIIAAAGNDGSCTNCVSEPWKSNAAKVTIVSSTTETDTLSSFSSQGAEVDVAAPGSNILSTYNSGDTSYSTLSGTSMATPHVAGVAALIKTLHPDWTTTQIDDRLKTTAKDLGAAGKDDKFGYGRIDAAAATAGAPAPAQCADGVDNDGDGLVDFPADPGCSSTSDNSELNAANQPPTACFTHSESGLSTSVNGACSADADGTIASWSWSWGDGTPAGSGASTSHAYVVAGTYTVTLTVTDNGGATASTSQAVTVTNPSDPDPGATTLSNGVTRSATSGAAGTEQFFKIQVPSGKSQLQVVLDGPACSGLLSCSPDLDLYVRRGARPTDSSYDCRPYQSGSDETCTMASPAADWWYVRVDVYAGSGVAYTIKATYT